MTTLLKWTNPIQVIVHQIIPHETTNVGFDLSDVIQIKKIRWNVLITEQ